MDSAHKRGKLGENDRISALPDEIRLIILGFLPTSDSVRTTILSTRWRNLWTKVTNLDFDDERDFNGVQPHHDYDTVDSFSTFVERVLYMRDSIDIRKFCLAVDKPDDMLCSSIDGWIWTAVQRNAVEIELELSDGRYFYLPQHVCMSKTLEVLKMGTTILCSYRPPASASSSSLKFLQSTDEENEDRKHGFYCPFLKDLTLTPVATYEDEEFKAYAPKLEKLEINLMRLEWSLNFSIYAPNLRRLCLEDVSLSTLSLEFPESLVEASIGFRRLVAHEEPDFPESATSLMAAISNVQYLFISAYSLEARYLPVFRNLTKLKLVLHESHYCELLPELLGKTPNLQDLALEDKTESDASSERRWVSPIVTPLCLKSHLKTISIRGFKSRKADKDAAMYLRRHCSVLEELTMYLGARKICWKKGASGQGQASSSTSASNVGRFDPY